MPHLNVQHKWQLLSRPNAAGLEFIGHPNAVNKHSNRSYADEEGLLFFETSAKLGTNVTEVFTAIANAIPETSLKGARGPGASAAAARTEESRVNLVGPRDGATKDACAC